MIRTICVAACLALTASCASSPTVRYYALAPVQAETMTEPADFYVGLGPISFPEYLKRPHIVTRSSDSRLRMAEFDRWAEPLDSAFTRTLAMVVDQQLDKANVVAFPYNNTIRPDYRVVGRVSRMEADQSGEVALIVQWGAGDADGNVIIPGRVNAYSYPVENTNDYDSIVAALNRAVNAFGRDIAATLQSRLRAPQDNE